MFSEVPRLNWKGLKTNKRKKNKEKKNTRTASALSAKTNTSLPSQEKSNHPFSTRASPTPKYIVAAPKKIIWKEASYTQIFGVNICKINKRATGVIVFRINLWKSTNTVWYPPRHGTSGTLWPLKQTAQRTACQWKLRRTERLYTQQASERWRREAGCRGWNMGLFYPYLWLCWPSGSGHPRMQCWTTGWTLFCPLCSGLSGRWGWITSPDPK